MAKKVLVIDDEESFLLSCKKILSGPTLEVHTAASMHEAFEKLGAENYDALISDIMLTPNNIAEGVKILEHVKKFCPTTRSIVVTGFGQGVLARNMYRMDVDFYFEKPISINLLKNTLKYMGIA